MSLFNLVSDFKPSGDQPAAIDALMKGFATGEREQTLLGVTGSGKTFTIANVIAKLDRPVLVLSHNKTLAAQLYSEFKSFFPDNAVEYFISYYDYYLPESYTPQTDTYIAKDASINENIEKLRLSATASLLERRDVIIIASVSCIYGLGSPKDYEAMCAVLEVGETINRDEFLRRLIAVQYTRNDTAPEKGEFRVRGDSVDVFEPQRDDFIRVEFWGDEVESLARHAVVNGNRKNSMSKAMFFPCKHFVMPQERVEAAVTKITDEMKLQVEYFERSGRLVEAQRIYQRVKYDIEMMREIGYCSGIENYSMYLSERTPGSRPYCLLDFFPDDKITIVDESHVSLPQVRGMFKADRSRKSTLVEHGFRLPSALENRPLKFEEFNELRGDSVFVSATPGDFETERCPIPIEQIVRPTGLLDPQVEIRPLEGQIDDVMAEVREASKRNERIIVTTLTKKSAERLADYLQEYDLRAKYLHSELDAIQRVRILNQLRNGDFDCLIGINLLREGIDLPEVALIAILDADKEGFLRSERSLIQVAGRAARNVKGRVVLYADRITNSIQKLLDTTKSRRKKQQSYNKQHNITPTTIKKSQRITISDAVDPDPKAKYSYGDAVKTIFTLEDQAESYNSNKMITKEELNELVVELENEMLSAAADLEFERAADLRDKIKMLANHKSSPKTK